MATDHLLQEVMEMLPSSQRLEDGTAELSRGSSAHCSQVMEMVRRLRLILWRSKEELKDFGGFYCLRLVLDQQSPLASYFIDLFSHLEFLLLHLRSQLVPPLQQPPRSIYVRLFSIPMILSAIVSDVVVVVLQKTKLQDTKTKLLLSLYTVVCIFLFMVCVLYQLIAKTRVNVQRREARTGSGQLGQAPVIPPCVEQLIQSLDRSLPYLRPVTSTCRLLYASCKMLPIPAEQLLGAQFIAERQFKRKGRRQGRQFSSNLLHCRMRHIASVYLDQEGCSRLSLLQELGKGTSATVYKGAFDGPDYGRLKTGGFVAVKMFKDGDSAGSSALGSMFGSMLFQNMQRMSNHLHSSTDRFLTELDKLVVAKHPNIVTPIGYIGKRTEGECGLVMELMDESLFDYLEKVNDETVPPLEELNMLDLMLEIARGMRFLHECDLIHLDLKPSNVLLRFSDGEDHPREVKIADLGIAKLSSFFTEEKMGTSCYMAPEICNASSQNVHYDDKVDVFSYGTTCFNILLGNPDACACSESTIPEFYEAVKTGRWKQWVQGRNPFLVKLIGRCWEMDPSMRPTFAMLCVLLQHAIQCLLVPSMLRDATQCLCPASMTLLKKLDDDKKLGHLQMYDAISEYHKQLSGVDVDLEVTERCVLHFESHVRANADRLPLDKKLSLMKKLSGKAHSGDDGENGSEVAIDASIILNSLENGHYSDDDGQNGCEVATNVSIFVKSLENGHFNGAVLSRNKILKGTYWCKKSWAQRADLKKAEVHFQNTLMESCLNEADPLILIKVQAYLRLLTQSCGATRDWKVGDLGSSIQQSRQRHGFKFCEDEAHVPLQVDTSLIPLLVGFWNIESDNLVKCKSS